MINIILKSKLDQAIEEKESKRALLTEKEVRSKGLLQFAWSPRTIIIGIFKAFTLEHARLAVTSLSAFIIYTMI